MTRPRLTGMSVDARFMFWVDASGSGCWTWTGRIKPNGYGVFKIGENNVYAHRYAYELFVGPIPAELVIDHLCRNRLCVRPDHLEPVTDRENILRGRGIGVRNSERTHCLHGHVFAEGNLVPSKNYRSCLACQRRYSREWSRRRRERLAKARA